jgi:hypothetical protein
MHLRIEVYIKNVHRRYYTAWMTGSLPKQLLIYIPCHNRCKPIADQPHHTNDDYITCFEVFDSIVVQVLEGAGLKVQSVFDRDTVHGKLGWLSG